MLLACPLRPISLAGGRTGKERPVALIPEMFSSFSGQRGRVSCPLGLQLILSPAAVAGAGLGELGCSPTRLSCPGPGFARSHAASSLAPSQSPEPPGGHRLPPMEWPEAGFLFLVWRQPLPMPPGSSYLRCVSSAAWPAGGAVVLLPDSVFLSTGARPASTCGGAVLGTAARTRLPPAGSAQPREQTVPWSSWQTEEHEGPSRCSGEHQAHAGRLRRLLRFRGPDPGGERSWGRLFDNINEPTEV